MKLTIKYKQKNIDIIIDEHDSVSLLKKQLQNQTKIPFIQQQIFYKHNDKKVILSEDQIPFKDLNLPSGVQLNVKNLGKQIKWNYVFFIEYLGPILIFPIFYLIGDKGSYTDIQCWALIMAILHYVKRQYETGYVHVFSRYSMPIKRVFINCLHYWIFFALLNSIELYLFPSGHTYSKLTIYILVGLWGLFQFCNYKCHMILSSFRRNKQKNDQSKVLAKRRDIPYGWGFNTVSCANYLWEALGWIMFSILTRCWTSYLFTAFSIYQMAEWAIKKHVAYKKQFGDKYPRGRKAMIPFIL